MIFCEKIFYSNELFKYKNSKINMNISLKISDIMDQKDLIKADTSIIYYLLCVKSILYHHLTYVLEFPKYENPNLIGLSKLFYKSNFKKFLLILEKILKNIKGYSYYLLVYDNMEDAENALAQINKNFQNIVNEYNNTEYKILMETMESNLKKKHVTSMHVNKKEIYNKLQLMQIGEKKIIHYNERYCLIVLTNVISSIPLQDKISKLYEQYGLDGIINANVDTMENIANDFIEFLILTNNIKFD